MTTKWWPSVVKERLAQERANPGTSWRVLLTLHQVQLLGLEALALADDNKLAWSYFPPELSGPPGTTADDAPQGMQWFHADDCVCTVCAAVRAERGLAPRVVREIR